jgi:DNA polymerase-1
MSSTRPIGPDARVLLVDASSFVFRAYHQSLNQDARYNARPSDGLPTGAVRLFFGKLLQFVREGAAGVVPTHLGIVFDKGSRESHRKQLFAEYKANRDATPEDLKPQMPLVRAAVRAFGLPVVELDHTEADDLIASYARAAEAAGAEVLIVSADKDLQQLVGPRIRFYDAESGTKGKPGYRPERNLDVEAVTAKWEGVPPSGIGDVLALMGDTSDNVPGVPGIGLKTAAQMILEHGDLERLLAAADTIKQPKRRENLLAHADQARLSRRLVELDTRLSLPVDPSELALDRPDGRRLVAYLKALELHALVKRVAKAWDLDPDAVEPDPELASASAGASSTSDSIGAGTVPPAPNPAPFDRSGYVVVSDEAQLAEWVGKAREAGVCGFHVHLGDKGIAGVALATSPGVAAYVPVEHRFEGSGLFGGLASGQVPPARAWPLIGALVEDEHLVKVGHDLKPGLKALAAAGMSLRGFDDVMLMSYVLESGLGKHALPDVSERHLGHRTSVPALMCGTGRSRVAPEMLSPGETGPFVAEQADAALRLGALLKPRLSEQDLLGVYEDLEKPMVPVLARMEAAGIKVDRTALDRLSKDFGASLVRLEGVVHGLAGEDFQIGSPKQIGDILFGRLGLPGGKKTPSGQWATGATALEELAAAGHDLPARILDWRRTSKLKSTYADALLVAADRGTDRIHTTFSLAATTTGRLSSSEPNLQNIPVRTEEGRRIRAAFVAADGHRILSADYSQVELRILAHIADIPELRQAFLDGLDIHAATASEMFGVPLGEVGGELRRRAKTINFGIIYGISAFGLADRLGISRQEASEFIGRYFERFPGIRDYIESTKAFCREHGFVQTLFGRVCHYPGIASRNVSERMGIERQAVNAPIQGTAADIIRRAMIRMQAELDAAGLKSRMLLQVHDELVFEVPDAEVEAAAPLITRVMADAAAPLVDLAVPLVVEAKAAGNWERAH